jgi:RecA-family ATPase
MTAPLEPDADAIELPLHCWEKIEAWRTKLDQAPKLNNRGVFQKAADDLILEAQFERDLGTVQRIYDAAYELGRDYAGLGDDDIQYIFDGAKAKVERLASGKAKAGDEPQPEMSPGAARSGYSKNADQRSHTSRDAAESEFKWIDTSRWDSEPCPQREWAVKDRIPLRQVTLLSGEGSIGKSIIELMCAVAHVTGKDWLGSLPEPGGAFYIGCEDDEPELRIRLTSIISHYGTTFNELGTSGFRFVSLAGKDAVLGVPDRNNIVKPTALFNHIYEQAGDLKPKHIGIDTSADVFAGNESDRAQVRQFIGLLRKLALVSNGSVVLLSHPSCRVSVRAQVFRDQRHGTTVSAPGCT